MPSGQRTSILSFLLLLLLALPSYAFAVDSRDPHGEILVENPDDPGGLKLYRPRLPGERWWDWFCNVFLWPHSAERDNHLFTTLDQGGHRVQFIPDVMFAVDGRWYMVLRGAPEVTRRMAAEIFLEPVGGQGVIRPVGSEAGGCGACSDDIYFIPFFPPEKQIQRVMSAFPLFGNAGGVADVLDEKEVRLRHKVLRDWLEDSLRGGVGYEIAPVTRP